MNTRDIYRTAAWWYACGYNDNRTSDLFKYVEPDGFADFVLKGFDAFTRHETSFYSSIQDSWKEYTQ